MKRVAHVRQVRANGPPRPESSNGLDGDAMHPSPAGYILEHLLTPPPGRIRVWGYVVVVPEPLDEPEVGMTMPMQPSSNGAHPKVLQLRPVARLVPIAAPQPKPEAPRTTRSLQPVRSGQAYCITSPPARGLVTPELAEALQTVFEGFARERGFTSEKPLEIHLARGFKAGSHGHGEGRAADIVAVGGKGLLVWKQEWEQAVVAADTLSDGPQRAETVAAERRRNLGYALYKALQEHGGWRVNQEGWRTYRGVMQLFGPWTATEGPWKPLQIKDPNPYQHQRLADQQWVFRAHQDHIHVAR
jgi:hypothetical protein